MLLWQIQKNIIEPTKPLELFIYETWVHLKLYSSFVMLTSKNICFISLEHRFFRRIVTYFSIATKSHFLKRNNLNLCSRNEIKMLLSLGPVVIILLFLIIFGHRVAPRLSAWYKCITNITSRATTDGQMSTSFTNRSWTALANTWVDTRILNTSTTFGTFTIWLTFTALTVGQWISYIAW